MEELLQVGVISSTHGLKGEVKVFPTTDDADRFKDLQCVILDSDKEQKVLEIQGVKFFKQFVILKFKEFNDINEVEKYKGKGLFVTRDQAVPLGEDEYFVADLIGLDVYLEDGTEFGNLTDVMETGANDVYVIKTQQSQEVLVPAIHDCILEVNLKERKMTIHLLDGLM